MQMNHTDNSLMAWPHQVPSPAMHTLADAHFIRGLEWGPPEWWQQWQRQRLAQMLHWLDAMPWWLGWVGAKVGPDSHTEALAGLPLMRREDYRALNEAHEPVVPAEHGKLTMESTSGSSGVSVKFWRSEMTLRINANHYWADHQRQGRDLTQRMAAISGYAAFNEGPHRQEAGEPWLQPGMQLVRAISQFSTEDHALWLCSHPFTYLATRPDVLSDILSTINMLNLAAPRLTQILTYAQTVDAALRKRTREAFGASIRDRYACEEVGPIAFQCPESDDFYHCAVGNVVVEVVDAQGLPVTDGAQGNVLVTGLHQWASPAVRYELGDLANWHACCPACGVSVPALSHLLGGKRPEFVGLQP